MDIKKGWVLIEQTETQIVLEDKSSPRFWVGPNRTARVCTRIVFHLDARGRIVSCELIGIFDHPQFSEKFMSADVDARLMQQECFNG